MSYNIVAMPASEVPLAAEPVLQHVVTTYASEVNTTISIKQHLPDGLLAIKPHEKTNPNRTTLVHQHLPKRHFVGQFVGTQDPPVEQLLPPGESPTLQSYIEKYLWLFNGTKLIRPTQWKRRHWAVEDQATDFSKFRLDVADCCIYN